LEFRRVLFRSHVPTHVHIGVNGANGRMALEEMAQLAPLRARADDKDRRCCLFVERGYERTDVSAEADVDRACWGDASDERRRRGGGLSSRLKIAGSREQGVPSANENWPSVRDRKRSLAVSAKELCPDRPRLEGSPEPWPNGNGETSLGAFHQRQGHTSPEHLSEQPLPPAVPHLHGERDTPAELDNRGIKKRHACLKTDAHTGAIDFHK